MPCRQLRAGAVAERERRDDEVARLDGRHLGADVLDDADELVADRAGRERRVAAVVPEVRAADAGQDDADDRVGRLDDGRVGPVAGLDRGEARGRWLHAWRPLSADRAIVGGPARGVLTGHPCAGAARGVLSESRGPRQRHRRVPDHAPGEGHPRAGRPAELRQAARARACAARRSPRWPASASSTTSAWSAATSAASPSSCSRRSPERCSSTTPSAPTSSTSRAPPIPSAPAAAPPGQAADPPGRAAHPRPIDRAGHRAQRPPRLPVGANALGRALYAPVFDSREQPANSARFTFLDPAAATSTPTGSASPRSSSRTCAPRPAATPTTASCRT